MAPKHDPRESRLTTIWPFALVAALAGCAQDPTVPTAPAESGLLALSLESERTIQYQVSQVKAMDLTLTRLDRAGVYHHLYGPVTLTGGFQFSALHLPVGNYRASLAAYSALATSSASLIGSTATDSLNVRSGLTTAVTMPPLQLSATPTGTWPVQVNVTLTSFGYSMASATASLATVSGLQVAGPTWTSTSKAFLWKNVLTFPVGVSTTSITVKATRPGRPTLTATKIATMSVVPGTNATASISLSL